MSNIGNEYGQILNSVLTTGEGVGLDDMCQGVVKRYRDAGEQQPNAFMWIGTAAVTKVGCNYYF